MEGIPRIESPPQHQGYTKLREIFFDIEKKARVSGNAEILMQLDRIPGLLLGPLNRISEGAEESAVAAAYSALHEILAALEQSKPAIGSPAS